MCADTFIQKTKKLYIDTRTQRNMAKLTEDISEVHSIMTKNIQDVLNHGERLDSEFFHHPLPDDAFAARSCFCYLGKRKCQLFHQSRMTAVCCRFDIAKPWHDLGRTLVQSEQIMPIMTT